MAARADERLQTGAAAADRYQQQRLLDRLCDEFEASWQADRPPRIEDYLARCPEESRPPLLLELLALELAYRSERGEMPVCEEYLTRFQEHAACVRQAFGGAPEADDTQATGAAPDDTHSTPAQIPPEHAVLQRFGEYELRRVLGRGGMGVVHQAFHTRLKRVVAIKMLPREQLNNAAAVARFEREMAAVGQLSHPNIVVAHDAGEVDGTHYLVMEFVDGDDLASLLERTGPLPVAEACELAKQTAVALQYAHEHGLVHRDIKPSNLMVTRDGVLKVLDLGLARLGAGLAREVSEITATGQIMGTLDYMAPEQAGNSHDVGIQADIYSLGATLYKLLSGQAPLADERRTSLTDKLLALAAAEPPPIESLRPDVPREVSAILRRSLAKDPSERFATPAELAEALTASASGSDLKRLFGDKARGTGQAVKTHGAKRVFQRSPWQRRWKPLVGVAVVVLLVLAAWRLWPTTPPQPPNQLLVRVERAGKLFTEEEFLRALPVRSGDALRIVTDVPSGLRPSLWAVDSEGKLHEFSGFEVKPTDNSSRVIYPANGQTLPVDDHVGTELILVCGQGEGASLGGKLRDALKEIFPGPPLPAGLPHNVLVAGNRDMVQVRTASDDVRRGFGDLQRNTLSELEDKLEKLRLRLRESCPFVAIVAFPHEP